MNQSRLVFVTLLIMIYFLSCNKINNKSLENLKILDELEKEVKQSLDERNARGDSISSKILLDTVYVKKIDFKNYSLAFAQYHTVDNKVDLSILGIDNFETPNTPTFLLVDSMEKKYDIDSVKIMGDSLHVFCTSIVSSSGRKEKLKIGFDLKFNGKAFPWSVN
jgi:hypothetical protein